MSSFRSSGWFGLDSSINFKADNIPNVTSKNGISPITSIVVSNPPAIAKPMAYNVLDWVQPLLLIKISENTLSDPNKHIIIPAFSRVERWLAR
ncbi:hypothetical protein D3C80_1646550 [compost metagenome]